MKLVQALQWAIAHQDAIFMFVGELVTACWALVIACRPLIKLFVKLADWTDNTWDNTAMKAVSECFDSLAATLDSFRRKLPVHFGPSTKVQPLTTKETRAAAAASLPPIVAVLPPLESKRPPPVTVLPAPEVIGTDPVQPTDDSKEETTP